MKFLEILGLLGFTVGGGVIGAWLASFWPVYGDDYFGVGEGLHMVCGFIVGIFAGLVLGAVVLV